MNRLRAFSLVASLAVSATAAAQCPAPGDCRKPHATPGCEMPECCEIVCKINPLCCDIVWDQGCADAAIEECDGISCPSPGSCTEPHPSAGCSDYTCCELIVTIDPWCTWASWDDICAREAARYCGLTQCPLEPPAAIDEAEPCYERFNDGWGSGIVSERIQLACGATMKGRAFSGGPRDLEWFALDGTARRRFALSITAEFPVELQYLKGGEEGPNETRWLAALGRCEGQRTLNFIVDAGTASVILGVGDSDRSWRSALECNEIDPDNPPGPKDPPPVQVVGTRWVVRIACLPLGDIDGDGLVRATDLGVLLGAWGPIDPRNPVDPLAPDADLDGNGEVGATDLALLLGTW